MSVDLVCVDPALINQVWPLAREFVKAAMVEGGLSSFAEVEADIYRGSNLLWLVWDAENSALMAAAVTSLNLVNGAMVGTVVAAGGKGLNQFGHLLPRLEQHFRDEGCVSSRICGRKGWGRYYPDYRIRAVILEKVL